MSKDSDSKEVDGTLAVDSISQAEKARDADFSALDKDSADAAASGEDKGSNRQVDKLKAELEDTKDRLLRSLAEFDNFRKRAIKERSELLKYQGEAVFQDLLDILDNLELALKHADADPANLRQGVALIHKLFLDCLKKWDLKAESAVGLDFDPSKHNAISRVEVKDANVKSGTVVNELKKAYYYKDKLLRPAEVVVAGEAESPMQEASGSDLLEEPEDSSNG